MYWQKFEWTREWHAQKLPAVFASKFVAQISHNNSDTHSLTADNWGTHIVYNCRVSQHVLVASRHSGRNKLCRHNCIVYVPMSTKCRQKHISRMLVMRSKWVKGLEVITNYIESCKNTYYNGNRIYWQWRSIRICCDSDGCVHNAHVWNIMSIYMCGWSYLNTLTNEQVTWPKVTLWQITPWEQVLGWP